MTFCEGKCSQCSYCKGFDYDPSTKEIENVACFIDHTMARNTWPFYRKINLSDAVECRMFDKKEKQSSVPAFSTAAMIGQASSF